MTREEIFAVWAPLDSVWSPWVSPVTFAQLDCGLMLGEPTPTPNLEVEWLANAAQREAIVLDLPGLESIGLAMALAGRGRRPVPVLNAAPQPELSHTPYPVAIDMGPIVKAICDYSPTLSNLRLPADAPPVFILDSERLQGQRELGKGAFDNRWIVFPQDFPSASFLLDHDVRQVLLVQPSSGTPKEDLAHVLLRWQQQGIRILSASLREWQRPSEIQVSMPSAFRRSWYRTLAMLGLRRSAVGGFGSFIPESGAG
ncbi:MAG TPA: hypothetical protein VLE48_12650 [Terriglobales bacterium]|nr:hypothetical protein [Terriglobales bacterium]